VTSTRSGSSIGDGLDWAELAKCYEACPDVRFDYRFELFDETYSTACETIDLKDRKIREAQYEQLMAIAPYLCCGMVDMEGCGIENEDMAALNEAMPHTKAVWRVSFGHGTSARTDAKRIRLVKDGVKYDNKYVANLKYCTECELLDVGHNKIKDISFVANMPNLRVAILAINYIEDISPIANCTNLEYLELFTCKIEDLSPLAGLTNLKHLNLNWNRFEDVTPLYNLTGLERLWLGRNELTEQEQADLQAALPNTVLNFDRSATGEGWRGDHPRYAQLCEEFNYEHPKNGGY